MACGCQGTPTILTADDEAPPPALAAANSSIEYVVLMPDGIYSAPFGTMQEAFELAAQTGGQARARAKRTAEV